MKRFTGENMQGQGRAVQMSLQARFKAALALADMSVADWAAQYGVTYQHVYQVLNGGRDSAKLTAEMEAFAQKHLQGAA